MPEIGKVKLSHVSPRSEFGIFLEPPNNGYAYVNSDHYKVGVYGDPESSPGARNVAGKIYPTRSDAEQDLNGVFIPYSNGSWVRDSKVKDEPDLNTFNRFIEKPKTETDLSEFNNLLASI